MIKRFFALFIIMALLCICTIPSNALLSENILSRSNQEGYFEYSENEDGTITIMMTDVSASGIIDVPNTIDGKPVTTISTYAFWDCVEITGINIGDNVIKIGELAFTNCPKLGAINVSERNVVYKSVDGVLFDAAMTSIIKCPSAKKGDFTMPDTVSRITQYSFFDCRSLTSVTLSASITSIPKFAFSNCAGIKNLVLPAGLTDIGESAFSYCTGIDSITIPNTVLSIGTSAFAFCVSAKRAVIGAAVIQIGNLAFSGCDSLEKFEVSPLNIRFQALDGVLYSKDGKTLYCYPCGKSGDVDLPDGITKLNTYSFYACKNIKRIIIPSEVTSIGDFAFVSCTNMTEMLFKGAAPKLGIEVFNSASPELKIYCFDENAASFEENGWENIEVIKIKTGDINGDDTTNSRDIAALQKHIIGQNILEELALMRADVNGDGDVNSRDIAALQKKILL